MNSTGDTLTAEQRMGQLLSMINGIAEQELGRNKPRRRSRSRSRSRFSEIRAYRAKHGCSISIAVAACPPR